MKAEDAKRLRDLLAKATPGPWSVHPDRAWVSPVLDIETPVCAIRWPADDITEDEAFANATLIAAAINALPSLLALYDAVDLTVIDDALEDMELRGMHNESGYQALKAMYRRLVPDCEVARPTPEAKEGA